MIEFICFGVNACLGAIFYRLYQHKLKSLNLLQDAPQLELDGQLTKNLSSAPDHTMPYVVIRGSVKAFHHPLQSVNAPQAFGVIHEKLLTEHQITWNWVNRWWYSREREIHRSVNSVPFVLQRSDGWGKYRVFVTDHEEASQLTLTRIYEHFEPHNPSFFQFLGEYMAGERSKGFQTIENMLTEGTILTAVGELVLRGGRMELRPPQSLAGYEYFLTALSRENLVHGVQSEAKSLRFVSITFGVVAGIFLAVTMYRVYVDRKSRMDRERFTAAGRVSNRTPREQLGESETCVVCLQNPREVLLLECGHVCCCTTCAEILSPPVCPICRSHIRRVVQAYIA